MLGWRFGTGCEFAFGFFGCGGGVMTNDFEACEDVLGSS